MNKNRILYFAPFLLALMFAVTACGPRLEDASPAETRSNLTWTAAQTVAEAESRAPTPMPVVSSTATPDAGATGLQSALIHVYERANPAVVYILVPPVGSGSGFVYSADGYIVTNYHVVNAGRSYEVVFANGERRRAELVGSDVDSDLAVLQVDAL
ncbi:MAG TPA: hypothetical protein DEP84_05780, partial [Chloroflexi bacterium]|nr:hypothetical protein [Chloroflexota bacterium]